MLQNLSVCRLYFDYSQYQTFFQLVRQVRSLRHQVPSKLAALLPEVMRNSLVFTVSSYPRVIQSRIYIYILYIQDWMNDMIRYTCRILESIVQVGEYCLQSYWWSYMSRLSKCLAVATMKRFLRNSTETAFLSEPLKLWQVLGVDEIKLRWSPPLDAATAGTRALGERHWFVLAGLDWSQMQISFQCLPILRMPGLENSIKRFHRL